MSPNKLMYFRKAAGKTQKDMASALHISESAYSKKERGCGQFKPKEIILTAQELNLDSAQVNEIFFENKLPNG
ncbi:MAG: helix-turn-helix domain-containing protein [Lachnospiraceae bacterium]|nr:helix-turn-helix domain-containing protein [Lachnospiraceae bacterium]